MECLRTFLKEYRSEEEVVTDDLGFYLVSNEEIKEYGLSPEDAEIGEAPSTELHPEEV